MNKNTLRQNFILSIAAAVLLWGIVALVFDYYYDLNDDILIKDIISGIYTGSPQAHNNQMLYPVSLLLCGLYSITGAIPWFGLLEIAGFIISFVIILKSMLKYIKVLWQKIVLTVLFTIMFATLYIWEIVMLQYTVVAGLLCLTASVIVYCHETDTLKEPVKEYLKAMVPAIILLFIAYNIRSEMFLLMCPFMAAAGLIRWAKEPEKNEAENYKGISDACNVKKYFSLIGVIAVVVIFTTVVDSLAYSSTEWKEFRRFFDARTDVYDFSGIPDYDANIDFYENNGIAPEQYELLVNYNFALDDSIDAQMLETIAEYAKSGKAMNSDGSTYSRTSKSLKTAIGEYVRNVKNIELSKEYDPATPFADEPGQYAPFGLVVMLLYVAIFVAGFYGKKKQLYFDIVVLLLFRSIAWIYIFQKGRIVPRITHPMYLIEIVIMLFVLLDEFNASIDAIKEKGKTGSSGPEITVTFCCITAVLLMITSVGCIGTKWSEVKEKSVLREELNEQSYKLNSLLTEKDNYYYLDVYSTVDWTEKVFDMSVSKKNQQLAGGWMAFSPLDSEKQSSYSKSIFFVTTQNADEMEWMNRWLCMKTGYDDSKLELIDTLDGKKGHIYIFEINQ